LQTRQFQSIRRQILYITYIFTFIIGLVIAIVGYVFFQSSLQKNLINSSQANLSYLKDYIDSKLNNIDQLVIYCSYNSAITSYVESDAYLASQRLSAYNVLSEYCQNNASSKYLHRVVITGPRESYIQTVNAIYSTTSDIASELPGQAFFEELVSSPMNYGYGLINDPFYIAREKKVLPLLKPITHKFNANVGGYMFLEISDELFTDALQNYYHDDPGRLILSLGSHDYIYEDGLLRNFEEEFTVYQKANDPSDDSSYSLEYRKDSQGQKYIAVTQKLSHTGCSVCHLIPRKQFLSGLGNFIPLSLFIFAVLILLTVIMNRLLNRTITAPVYEIQNRLTQISTGDFSRDTSIEWNHELGDIGKKVNDLAENIKRLLDSALESEKEKRDLEYKILQSQVNPHFLYNTLNSIKWMAITQGATGISEMTTALSRLLKSIAKGTRLFIPLRDEISLLQDYFTIQQYRYGGTLQMDILLPQELENFLILKFTLQPLVENAIFHGIEPTGRAGTIRITVSCVNDSDIQIEVRDNGVGMSQETIEHILNHENAAGSDFFRDFGVSNIQKRLKYEYGSDYGIRIDSVPGEYTGMIVVIPMQTLEDRESQTDNISREK